ncbi:protein FAM3B-like [Chiloscyllium punctatum]|uniref:protein FAM3B-like n=1 Tax=Chiloscyllium punctatum TaxID=137246 RepID=UPI003B639599
MSSQVMCGTCIMWELMDPIVVHSDHICSKCSSLEELWLKVDELESELQTLLLSDVKNNFGRGMNIAIVEAKTGKHVNIGSFDLWGGDNSGQMIEFIKKAPDGSLILMATFDNRSTRLNEEAKKYIEELGSKLIRKLHFRGNWVFLGTKGFTLPENFQREKIINNEGTSNRYGSWPREIQIDGCFSPKTDYL